MNLKDIIYKRKSVRKYKTEDVSPQILQEIDNFLGNLVPLYQDIKVRLEFVDRENVKCLFPWISKKVIAFFSEHKKGYLENAGFMMQQVDLYLQTLGLGSCWIGMGNIDTNLQSTYGDELKYVIMMAFGYPQEEIHRDINDFKRKPLGKITDQEDCRLEVARLAPSSINNQPWYFTHEENMIHTYCSKRLIFNSKTLHDMHLIDIGIALAHIYVSNTETFTYFSLEAPKELKGYDYVGSFTI